MNDNELISRLESYIDAHIKLLKILYFSYFCRKSREHDIQIYPEKAPDISGEKTG